MTDGKQIEVEAETHRAEMRARIARARTRFDMAVADLDRLMEATADLVLRIERDECASVSEASDMAKSLSKAIQSLLTETRKYEGVVLENTGLVADAPLDLDAIRLEIGSRLDRLRAAG